MNKTELIEVLSTRRTSLQIESGDTFQGDDNYLATPLKGFRIETIVASVAGQADHP